MVRHASIVRRNRLRRKAKPRGLKRISLGYYRAMKNELESLQDTTLVQFGMGIKTDDFISETFHNIKVNYVEGNAMWKQLALKFGIDIINQNTVNMRNLLSVDVIGSEPWLKDEIDKFVGENVSLIESVATEYLRDIEQLVYRAVRTGLSTMDLASQIRQLTAVSNDKALLIAGDQIHKFHSALSIVRMKENGVSRYEWMAGMDARTREEHAILNGQIFYFDDPPVTVTKGKRAGERNHPGMDINCRCSMIPIIERFEDADSLRYR